MAVLSLIIPCFNEEKNIKRLFSSISKLGNKLYIEVVIVNNGSTDNSKKIIEQNKKKIKNIKVVTIKKNIGFGHGIKQGISKSTSDIICYTHGDLQIDQNNVLRAYKIFKKINSKKILVKGRRVGRNFFDIFFTFLMGVINSILFQKILYDIHAQPNLFSKKLVRNINLLPNDMSIDLFIFLKVKFSGHQIVRFKVNFLKRQFGIGSNDSLLKKLKYSLLSLFSSLKIFLDSNYK